MNKDNSKNWHLNRQVNLSVLVQLILLASLILGSWINLQRQLDLLQHDVNLLIESNQKFYQKLDSLTTKSIEYEYRLQAIEKKSPHVFNPNKPY